MKKIALFANHQPGLEIAQYLRDHVESEITALFLTGENVKNDEQILKLSGLENGNVFIGNIFKDADKIQWFQNQSFDGLICVYWPWLLPKEIFQSVNLTVNFHPALLPINRGWFPHVHSLIDGTKAGVTLHQIAEGADTGDIWVQEEEQILPTDTAKTLYLRLQQKIVTLFLNNWDKILSGEIKPFQQDEKLAIYRPKKAILDLDYINLDQTFKARDLINLLRARSFGDLGFAYYEENGEKIYMNLRVANKMKFE